MAKKGFLTIFDLHNQIIGRFQDDERLEFVTINDRFNEPYRVDRSDIQEEDFLQSVIDKYIGAVEAEYLDEEESETPNHYKLFILEKLTNKLRHNQGLIDAELTDDYREGEEESIKEEIETDPNIFIEGFDVEEEEGPITIFELNL